MRDRFAAERRGHSSESWAALWLRLKGYRILGRRVKTHLGEIDLVAAAPFGPVCFVEVKARGSDEAAAFALDEWRLRRVITAAERLAARFMRPGDDVRIDAILIVPGRWPRHLTNIWHG